MSIVATTMVLVVIINVGCFTFLSATATEDTKCRDDPNCPLWESEDVGTYSLLFSLVGLVSLMVLAIVLSTPNGHCAVSQFLIAGKLMMLSPLFTIWLITFVLDMVLVAVTSNHSTSPKNTILYVVADIGWYFQDLIQMWIFFYYQIFKIEDKDRSGYPRRLAFLVGIALFLICLFVGDLIFDNTFSYVLFSKKNIEGNTVEIFASLSISILLVYLKVTMIQLSLAKLWKSDVNWTPHPQVFTVDACQDAIWDFFFDRRGYARIEDRNDP